jgi:1-acyl-sn-glycerol-3-phosphate acyltransferase
MRSETLSRRMMTSFLRATVPAVLDRAYAFDASTAHVPRDGAAILVCNHVSFIDWLFLGAALPRVPRFVMHHHHWKVPALRWFFDLFEVIPIAPRKEDPARLEAAMEKIDRALADGELVAIWPEGTMTPDGELSVFRPGVERIVARRPVPVVPLALRGLWGSFFSRAGGEPMKKIPRRRGFHRVELVAGAPIPPEQASTEEIRTRIAELRGDAR